MYSIVIPVFNCNEYAQECVDSIGIRRFLDDYEIIIVDNGSDIPFIDGDKVIRNEENKGFPEAVNQGIEAATGDVIILLNSDTIVTPDWADRLNWHLNNGLDIVNPYTNNIAGIQRHLVKTYYNEQDLAEVSNELYEQNKHKQLPHHRMVGFCLAMKKVTQEKVGLFDTIYSYGNFEDDDYTLRAIEAGFKTGIAQDTFIHHFGSCSFKNSNIDFNALLNKNRYLFEAKWAKKYKKLVEMVGA